MKLKLMLLALLISAIHLGAEEAPRVWTNSDGKKINATLKSYDGAYVTLERGGRTYDIAAHTLSAEDQAYLKARDEKIEQEKAARLAAIRTGSFEMTLERKMFDEPKAYYSTTIGKSTRDALKKKGKKPFEYVGSAPENEKAKVYVPASYDGETAYGIYIHISPGNGPDMPNYQSILDKRKMIMASPARGGNGEELMRRIMLALDTVATLQGIYKIDPKRVYIGGLSGGGITAMEAQLVYPDIWAGAISHARGMNLGSFGEYYSEIRSFDERDFHRMSRMKQRFAVISGEKDYNYDHCRDSSAEWADEGFDIRFFDIPGMGHENASADAFKRALDWVGEVAPFKD